MWFSLSLVLIHHQSPPGGADGGSQADTDTPWLGMSLVQAAKVIMLECAHVDLHLGLLGAESLQHEVPPLRFMLPLC